MPLPPGHSLRHAVAAASIADPRAPRSKRCGASRDKLDEMAAVATRDLAGMKDARDPTRYRPWVLVPDAHVVRIQRAYFVASTVVVEYALESNEPFTAPATSCGWVQHIAAFDLAPKLK
jgi:hypothetical protein